MVYKLVIKITKTTLLLHKIENMKNITFLLISIVFLSSCVTQKKYNELQALSDKYLNDKQDCENKLNKNESSLEDKIAELDNLTSELNKLKDEKAQLVLKQDQLNKEIANYKAMNQNLADSKDQILSESSSKQQQLNEVLAQKERELAAISAEQAALDAQLKAREAEVKQVQEENAEKSNRIQDLEIRLLAKDKAIQDLKSNINIALKGFSSDEVQVVEKQGKLHVSLSEKLLFKSGSFDVDVKGEDAIIKLASVLSTQEDFDIVVEGHTDDDPFNGSGTLKDNWDLSVKRATSVVRLLTEKGGVSPTKVAASGRGEYIPVAENETKEGKAKNRRTEIILSPKLDKILDILNKN